MHAPRRVRIFNGQFDALTSDQAVSTIFDGLADGRRGWICTVNVAVLMMMRSNPALQSHVDNASIAVVDGQPVIWASRLFGHPLPERVAGIDLIEKICARASATGSGVFLLGASPDVVQKLASKLHAHYPSLNIHFRDGYFSQQEAHTRAAEVARSGARILLVGMGVPRQENFIRDHWDELGVNYAIGVGGSFDVLCGLRSRAPAWMQHAGLEWVHRLIQEPRRLFMRYFTTGAQFLLLMARGLLVPAYRER
jgi:N-acetylglucosaminyldiphosphoundecaprenol N-acetyl-beta-D-mannosaminyltransferase